MKLKAYTRTKERVSFTLEDCPVFISDNVIALVGKKNSDLISYDTIIRGDEASGIWEGDEVYENDSLVGYVIYSRGFKLQTLDNKVKKLCLGSHIKVKEGNRDTVLSISKNPERSMLLFKYKEYVIQIAVFLCKRGDGMIGVHGSSCPEEYIDPQGLRFFTGLVDKSGKNLFYGECENGHEIVLHNLMPCIKVSQTEYKPFDQED